MSKGEQLEFQSLAFPKDREVLFVGEVALKFRVTDRHVLDLIEEGLIQAVNVAGAGMEWVRVPEQFFKLLAEKTGISEEVIRQVAEQSRSTAKQSGIIQARKCWRIPHEGYKAFLKERHSFHIPIISKKS